MILNNALMQSVSRQDKVIFTEVIKLVKFARDYVDSLPEQKRKKLPPFECHSMCRGIVKHLKGCTVVDGHYFGIERAHNKKRCGLSRFAHHSWLRTPSGAIIDLYPVGFITITPVLVVNRGTYKAFGSGFYIPDKNVQRSFGRLRITHKSRVLSELIGKAKNGSTKK
jgi:hypothetical protein